MKREGTDKVSNDSVRAKECVTWRRCYGQRPMPNGLIATVLGATSYARTIAPLIHGWIAGIPERRTQKGQAVTDELVLVPRKPTQEMLKAAWADALAEDAEGVWNSMIEAYENSRKDKP